MNVPLEKANDYEPIEFHPKEGDEMVNDEEIEKQMKFEQLCESGDCSTIPPTNLLKIKVIRNN